jgi:hypothetical protein
MTRGAMPGTRVSAGLSRGAVAATGGTIAVSRGTVIVPRGVLRVSRGVVIVPCGSVAVTGTPPRAGVECGGRDAEWVAPWRIFSDVWCVLVPRGGRGR